jgi:hypothetical protein
MTDTQPKSMRLVDSLADGFGDVGAEIAAELRRQHAEIERLTKLCYDHLGELTALRAAKQMQQRIDELKETNGGRSAA